jgi:hypothetical protein
MGALVEGRRSRGGGAVAAMLYGWQLAIGRIEKRGEERKSRKATGSL